MLYIGADRNRQLKLFPLPPDRYGTFFPYSTRSFAYQASKELGGCGYNFETRGTTLGDEPVFEDWCGEPGQEDEYGNPPRSRKCHMLSGFTRGEITCALWGIVSGLCQTDMEKKFLHWYLNLVKDRTFPMLIPQARIGIAERRRPDFVLFVPLQSLKYEWYAVELDGAHTGSDEQRDMDLSLNGYKVLSFRPEGPRGYYAEVQTLLEKIQMEMDQADQDGDSVAVERPVRSHESTIPF
jgi:hypothetical protein